MTSENQILLGTIVKTHGFDGSVVIKTERDFSGILNEIESVFLVVEGKPVPFFIDTITQTHPGTLVARFDGYESNASVKEFLGCNVLVSGQTAPNSSLNELPDLKGFKVLSSKGKLVGDVTELIFNPGQILLNVRNTSGKEYLIPLHEELIKHFDSDNHKITIDIPRGLLDL
ncbi:MAG: ribosome maturation factor RimM [Bacteroidales bacterium]